MPRIILTNGKELEIDAIFYISFDPDDRVTIHGWREGLNQTEDTFLLLELKQIRFDREDE